MHKSRNTFTVAKYVMNKWKLMHIFRWFYCLLALTCSLQILYFHIFISHLFLECIAGHFFSIHSCGHPFCLTPQIFFLRIPSPLSYPLWNARSAICTSRTAAVSKWKLKIIESVAFRLFSISLLCYLFCLFSNSGSVGFFRGKNWKNAMLPQIIKVNALSANFNQHIPKQTLLKFQY